MDDNQTLICHTRKIRKSRSVFTGNSVKMGELLAVHNEKLDKQDRIDAVLFEKIEQVDQKLDRHCNRY